jgi:hypothetical protein
MFEAGSSGLRFLEILLTRWREGNVGYPMTFKGKIQSTSGIN